MAREGLAPAAVAFVDDNSDNAFSMFMHFALLEKQRSEASGKEGVRAQRGREGEGGCKCVCV
eukprot:1162917-Prymnesium_polylepis.1